MFGEINTRFATGVNLESTLVEFMPASGEVTKQCDFAALIGDYMRNNGDDPARFVRESSIL